MNPAPTRLRRVLIVAELDNGDGVLVDSDNPRSGQMEPLAITLVPESMDVGWNGWDEFSARVDATLHSLNVSVRGLGGYTFVRDIESYFARYQQATSDATAIAAPRAAIGDGS